MNAIEKSRGKTCSSFAHFWGSLPPPHTNEHWMSKPPPKKKTLSENSGKMLKKLNLMKGIAWMLVLQN
jgi:hypothetical protein